jgi:hypothetical protein
MTYSFDPVLGRQGAGLWRGRGGRAPTQTPARHGPSIAPRPIRFVGWPPTVGRYAVSQGRDRPCAHTIGPCAVIAIPSANAGRLARWACGGSPGRCCPVSEGCARAMASSRARRGERRKIDEQLLFVWRFPPVALFGCDPWRCRGCNFQGLGRRGRWHRCRVGLGATHVGGDRLQLTDATGRHLDGDADPAILAALPSPASASGSVSSFFHVRTRFDLGRETLAGG